MLAQLPIGAVILVVLTGAGCVQSGKQAVDKVDGSTAPTDGASPSTPDVEDPGATDAATLPQATWQVRVQDVFFDDLAFAPGSVYAVGRFSGSKDFGGVSRTSVGSAPNTDVFLAKYSLDGKLLWVDSFGTPSDDSASTVSVAPDGTVAVTAFLVSGNEVQVGGLSVNTSDASFLLARYSQEGVVLSVRSDTFLLGAAFNSKSALVVAGASLDLGPFYAIDAANKQLWSTTGLNGSLYLRKMVVAGSDEIYACGHFDGKLQLPAGEETFPAPGQQDAILIKLDDRGQPSWATGIGSPGLSEEYCHDLAVDARGDVYVAVKHDRPVPSDGQPAVGGPRILLAKFSSTDGNRLWSKSFEPATDDYLAALAVQPTGALFLLMALPPDGLPIDLGGGAKGGAQMARYASSSGSYLSTGSLPDSAFWKIAFHSSGDLFLSNDVGLARYPVGPPRP